MEKINQKDNSKIIQTKKSVEWLVNNTTTATFDPITFTGYQRSIDGKHCERIVEYIKKDFFLPTSIICATHEEFSENSKLTIVDGQHRIEAFKMLMRDDINRYEEIKKYELSVIILVKPSEKEEIDTFITINKTSKKVDTSLAFVLRNKLNYLENSDNLNISKFEYLAVEVAWKLNYNEFGLWKDRILFEGPKLIENYISLNAFVKSFRVLLRYMEKYKIINVNWMSEVEIKELIKMLEEITGQIWKKIYNKWIILFDDAKNNKILQGAIGFSSINRLIVIYLKEFNKELTLNEFKELISNIIQSIEIDYRKWLPGNTYSKYSSESGYNFVAIDLKDHSYKFY